MTKDWRTKYKPRRTRARYLIGAPDYVAEIRDNGGKTVDRFTVAYTGKLWEPSLPEHYRRTGGDMRTAYARAMCENPSHPQGFGLWIECVPGPHLGKLITWESLPDACKRCVIADGVDDKK